MKHIANLGITTKEGFSVKQLERFPSMEWGDEGGMRADLYYKNIRICQVFQEGNGGEAIAYMDAKLNEKLLKEVQKAALACLKRLEPNSYGPQGYDWLKNKTPSKIDDGDYEAVVNNIEQYYDDLKQAKKIFKKGYTAVAVIDNYFKVSYLYCDFKTIEETKAYLTEKHPNLKYDSLRLIVNSPNLSTL
ncbi:MAG: hypothetical protein KBT06_04395 [Prevotellaceae bacterium]|nr:hypothetical protein [Candidatus Colivivens equi]